MRRIRPHGAVAAWLRSTDPRLLRDSAFFLGEIQEGIEITRSRDPGRAAELERWADEVQRTYEPLAMDAEIWQTWAKLMHRKSDTLAGDAELRQLPLSTGSSS